MGRFSNLRIRHPGLGPVVAASLVSAVGVLPVFLLGAIAVLVRADLGFGEAQLGLAVSVYWAAAALSSVSAGRFTERLGGRRALAVAAMVSAAALAGAATAWSWGALVAWLVLGGIANVFSQLASNLRVADAVSHARQGLAFGIKQAAVPAATLVGGLAVPVIALPLGWRWAFVAAAVTALVVGIVQSRGVQDGGSRRRARGERAAFARRPLIVLGMAGAFGAAAATAMAAFIVEYGVSVGVRAGPAGLILAIGSLAAMTARILMGWRADRRGRGNLLMVAGMLAMGGAAVAAFPLVASWPALVVVTMVAYAVGWGWPGLFNFTVVRWNPRAPAAATGVTQAGVYWGGVGGPLAFGFLVSRFGYPAAWWAASASLLTAAALMLVGRFLAGRAWLPPAEPVADGRR